MNGKGSTPRPILIGKDEYVKRWKRTFSKQIDTQSLSVCGFAKQQKKIWCLDLFIEKGPKE